MTRNAARAVLPYAAFSIAAIFALTVAWESWVEIRVFQALGFEYAHATPAAHWGHVVTTMAFSALAVAIVTGLAVRLVGVVRDKENTLDMTQAQRRAFAADAAHELRTPLAVLLAHIDTLDEDETTLALRQDVERITRIVEQVLAKSRLEILEVKPGDRADLAKICRDTTVYLAPLVIKEGRSIELVGAEEACEIRGDASSLEHAVRNLIENAIKYSNRGSTITVKVDETPAVHVMDRGRGVEPDIREAIFERFRRADRRADGAGLGLAIVRTVAVAHGARVEVSDAPGGGAVFSLVFPKLKANHVR